MKALGQAHKKMPSVKLQFVRSFILYFPFFETAFDFLDL